MLLNENDCVGNKEKSLLMSTLWKGVKLRGGRQSAKIIFCNWAKMVDILKIQNIGNNNFFNPLKKVIVVTCNLTQ